MRNISFMITPAQVIARTKDITRRLGWLDLEVGERLQGCEKCQGRRHGEPLIKLAIIEVVSIRREKLRRLLDEPRYGRREVIREGFPTFTRQQFVEMFCKSHKGCTPDTAITRIEFRYV